MKMRLAWYAGASTVLAAGVVLSAFQQRANFYSAMVYLFQSNLCMMILVNLVALVYVTFVYTLQRICFGQLRAIEVEQLYERAWFAVTETCLAMTIFRDEIGGFFIVMFVALLTGKVWGWIGEGRIEALEQQPPANPRLFHARLIVSLLLSLGYDSWLLYYAVRTVIRQARPDMMVMFLFEFAVLLVTSLHTALRYSIILLDTSIIKKQTQERLQERRRQVREERAAILRRREAGEPDDGEPLPDEDDVDEMDIEVPGWEAKGQYVLGLDLWTDFTKLCIYAVFFFVLLTYYGLPLHIIRDLFLTVRSFVKRLGALMKYRQAIRDMNKYADATEEELARENTCIICREDMHVWNTNDPTSIERTRPKKLPCGHILHLGCLKSWMERQQVCPTCRRSVVINDAGPRRNGDAVVFRIGLNMGGPEGALGGGPGPAAAGAGANAPPMAAAPGQPPAPAAAGAAPGGPGADANHQNHDPQQQQQQQQQQQPAGNQNGNRGGIRMFNFGPFRLGFAQGGPREIQEMAQRLGMPVAMAGDGANPMLAPPGVAAGQADAANNNPGAPMAFNAPAGLAQQHGLAPLAAPLASSYTSPASILADLQAIERRIEQGTLELQLASAEAQTLRLMVLELQRIRQNQASVPPATAGEGGPGDGAAGLSSGSETAPPPPAATAEAGPSAQPAAAQQAAEPSQPRFVFPQAHGFGQPATASFGFPPRSAQPPTTAVHLTPDRSAPAIPSGSPELPAGVQIPAGWSLLPLQRFQTSAPDAGPAGARQPSTSAATAEAATTAAASERPPEDETAGGPEAEQPSAAAAHPTRDGGTERPTADEGSGDDDDDDGDDDGDEEEEEDSEQDE